MGYAAAMDAAELPVIVCPAAWRPAALRKLHEDLPADQQAALVEALDRTGPNDAAAWEGLLVVAAPSGGEAPEILGATWVQTLPGNTAVVWPPPPTRSAADHLVRAAGQWCGQRHIPLAQLIVAEHAYPSTRLENCGFARLADLLYLFADAVAPTEPGEAEAGAVKFLPARGTSRGDWRR